MKLFSESNLTIDHNLTNGTLSIKFANANAKKDFTNSFILANSLVIDHHNSNKSSLDLKGTKMCLLSEPDPSTLNLINLVSNSKLYVLDEVGIKTDPANKIDFISKENFIKQCSITTGTYETILISVPDFLPEVIYN